jgi:hypothetical protein
MAEILNISNKNMLMFLDYCYCFVLQFFAIDMLQMEEERETEHSNIILEHSAYLL